MSVRPFALVPASALAALRGKVEEAVAAWSRDWGVASPSVACRRAWERGDAVPAWRAHVASAGAAAWFAWQDDAHAQLQRVLFAPDRSYGPQAGAAEMAADAAVAAFEALVTALGDALAGQGAVRAAEVTAPEQALAAGSGAVLAEVRLERCALWVLAENDTVRRIVPPAVAPAPSLAPVDLPALLADQPVRLPVAVGRATAKLGSLLALAPGDVIRLDTLADQPLVAATPDGKALLRGYLGTNNHHFALDVVAGGSNLENKHDQA